MEPNEIQAALAEAVEEVLETMCFAGILASAEGTGAQREEAAVWAVTAEVRFQGHSTGSFRLSAPLDLARAVGAGFLGREEFDVSEAQAADVVCELANMICGSVLSRLESQAAFQISHPTLVPPEPEDSIECTGANRWFDLGDGILAVSLRLRRAA